MPRGMWLPCDFATDKRLNSFVQGEEKNKAENSGYKIFSCQEKFGMKFRRFCINFNEKFIPENVLYEGTDVLVQRT